MWRTLKASRGNFHADARLAFKSFFVLCNVCEPVDEKTVQQNRKAARSTLSICELSEQDAGMARLHNRRARFDR